MSLLGRKREIHKNGQVNRVRNVSEWGRSWEKVSNEEYTPSKVPMVSANEQSPKRFGV
jgi:hypothetical protein